MCGLIPGSVRLDLGDGITTAPIRTTANEFEFELPPRDRELGVGSYKAVAIASNGLEARSTESYAFSVATAPPTGILASGALLALVGTLVAYVWVRRAFLTPRDAGAYLVPIRSGDGPDIWPEGTEFRVKTRTTIGRRGDADIVVPNEYNTIHRSGVTLYARDRRSNRHFLVKPGGPEVLAWIEDQPVRQGNNLLRAGQVLSIDGVLNFELRLQKPTYGEMPMETQGLWDHSNRDAERAYR